MFEIGVVREVDAENYRVKVEFISSGLITDWIRVATLYSGNGYGLLMMPDVGDEVLVANVHGEFVVIGRLFGGDRPPSCDEGEMVLKHVSGTEVRIRRDGEIEISINDSVQARLKPTGEVEIEANGDVKITAQGPAEIKAPEVKLGNTAIGGVVTDKTWPTCPVTGAPILGSQTVKAQS